MRLTTETFGGGDTSWLDSAHGTDHALTASGAVEDFTDGTHIREGVLLSGVEVDIADRADLKPWTGAAGEVLGYILFDQPVTGTERFAAPVIGHGRVRLSRLPVPHVPAAATTVDDDVVIKGGDDSGFIFNEGSDQ